MRKILFILILCFSFPALSAESSESALNDSDYTIHAALGFTRGGLALGGEFEARKERTYGWGGYLRLLPKDDEKNANGIKSAGAFVRPHFHRRAWDLFLTGGLGLHMVDGNNGGEDESALGVIYGTGVYYQLNETMALGLEQLALYAWLADDYRGLVDQHVLFKMRWHM